MSNEVKQDNGDLAREVSAQICNVLNTQHPTIDWPHSTITMPVESALSTARREVREAAFKEAVRLVQTMSLIEARNCSIEFINGAQWALDGAARSVTAALEASANQKGEMNEV